MRVAVIVMTIVLYSLTAFAEGDTPAITRHYGNSLLKLTETGLFGVELMIKGEQPKVGMNAADIILHDRNDRDVPGAEITVTPWMSSMGHGVFEKPVVTERGGGLYTVEDIRFSMEGPWELKIAVKKNDESDRVTFEFPDIKGEHEHAVTHAPADLDLSATRLSDRHIFKVTYGSKLEPIVINRIHSWGLRVETTDGRPVSGAKITVGGNMPEHGHGLPTAPEMIRELGGGGYLIGGMKFSMPGWWVIEFHIKTGDSEDTVHFNLLLR
jgi:hypothetical protein